MMSGSFAVYIFVGKQIEYKNDKDTVIMWQWYKSAPDTINKNLCSIIVLLKTSIHTHNEIGGNKNSNLTWS